MALILIDVRLFSGGADLTGQSNKAEVVAEVEEKERTSFGSRGWKEVLGGLAATEISAEGQWQAGDPGMVDDETWAALGGLGAWTACPDGAAVGSLAWLTRVMRGSYKLGGAVGDVAPWTVGARGSWPLVRGVLAHPPGTARTATGTGTAQQLGAVAAGRHLYAALHVLSVAGTDTPSITVEIESDDSDAFTTAIGRATFTAATARGGQVLRVPGPITDTWWRPKWTVTGTTPSFLFALALGIK
ncbi:hypothetical protein [Umezawaea beigongshangensis]|uniref:hypothetical protein n=1 Tax=Umezawaea beigongshangensis TaxID=2780383 RepID=UPI0018F23185|nr:hypothetical protein [Umezawaea beigongshangensis]